MNASLCGPFFNYYLGEIHITIYNYIENENVYIEKFPKILEDNPEAREIKPRSENYMSGVFKEVRAFRKESSDHRSCQQSYGPLYLHRQHL